jgi:voltage-gated potassium channel
MSMKLFLPFRTFIKIYISIFAFALILLSGVIGYMLIEGYNVLDSLYMTIVTLSTVGYREVQPLSESGKVFTIFLILINLSTFTYFITQLSAYFLDGEFASTYKLYKMKDAINELEGHIIICGFGRTGMEAAKIFHNGNQQFVVVEKAETRRDDLSFDVPFILNDDATRDETLLQAGILKAKALLTTLPEDADNLYVVLTARELNPKIKIISRAGHDSSVRKLKTAGASNVIMPDKIGGAHMATLVLNPDIKEFVDLMATQGNEQFNISEIETSKTISLEDLDSWKSTGATILGVRTTEGGYFLNPTLKTVLNPGNRLMVMGSREQLNKLQELVTG